MKTFKAPDNRRDSNNWQITKGNEAGRWRWEVDLARRDGSKYERAGTRKTEQILLKSRDAAYAEFNADAGRNAEGFTVRTDRCSSPIDEDILG